MVEITVMDIHRQQKPKSVLRTHWYLVPIVLSVVTAVFFTVGNDATAFSAEQQNLSIAQVQRGNFEVSVRGPGRLAPTDVRWLSANVSGRLESIHAKPGSEVKPGDLIVQLSNPQLLQRVEEVAWELQALQAENTARQVSSDADVLDQQARMMEAKMLYESAKLNLDAEQMLLEEGNATVSRLDYQRSVLQTEQHLTRWNIEKQRLAKLKETKVAQINAGQARYKSLQKSYLRAKQQADFLSVRATLDGVVQVLPLEAGQQIAIGENIAKLARQNRLIAELQIPERQVNGVAAGQAVSITTRHSSTPGKVIRIDPAVLNGVVQVDVAFVADLPSEARPDLTVDGIIRIHSVQDTLFVGRPTFAQGETISSVYRLSEDGKFAERVAVTFGLSSASEIQVINGLESGQRIILSDTSGWDHLERISIQ